MYVASFAEYLQRGDDFGKGNDTIYGGKGNDTIWGGFGDDMLRGGQGDDWFSGDGGADTIHGGKGNDNIYGGEGDDVLYGGTGNDMFWGDGGNDTIHGGDGDDQMTGCLGDDKLYGGAGNDSFACEAGKDLYDGGSGNGDRVEYLWSSAGVTVNLQTGKGQGGEAEGDTLVSIENLLGSKHADVLTGDALKNVLEGDDGDDVLHGNAGGDFLYGGKGNDTLHGGTGDDTLHGGAGDDRLEGGTGADTFDFRRDTARVIPDAATDDDTIIDFEEGDTIRLDMQTRTAGDAKWADSAAERQRQFNTLQIKQTGDDTVITYKLQSRAYDEDLDGKGKGGWVYTYQDAVLTLLGVDADTMDVGDFAFG